jgi:NAD(P)H dehydrogenase (quinone)
MNPNLELSQPSPDSIQQIANAMNVVIVSIRVEPGCFNGALFRTAQESILAARQSAATSDLCTMKFNPVSDRRNVAPVKNPDCFRQQIEGV